MNWCRQTKIILFECADQLFLRFPCLANTFKLEKRETHTNKSISSKTQKKRIFFHWQKKQQKTKSIKKEKSKSFLWQKKTKKRRKNPAERTNTQDTEPMQLSIVAEAAMRKNCVTNRYVWSIAFNRWMQDEKNRTVLINFLSNSHRTLNAECEQKKQPIRVVVVFCAVLECMIWLVRLRYEACIV